LKKPKQQRLLIDLTLLFLISRLSCLSFWRSAVWTALIR